MTNEFDIQLFDSVIDGTNAPFGLLSRADKNIIDNLGTTYLGISSTAAAANKLANARSINIQDATGTNTGTAISFDGSNTTPLYIKLPSTIKASLTGNASTATSAGKLTTAINLSIADADGTNSGTTTSFNGSAATVLSLPPTIKATLTGNASTATKLANARSINIQDATGTNTGTAISFDGSNATTLNIKLPSTIKASLTGNASTATTLQTARSINGLSFDGSTNVTNFAVCSTASDTAAKTVTIAGITSLVTGTRICIKFTNTNTASNATLQVNSLAAAAIMYRGYNVVAGALTTDGIYDLVYTGSVWELVSPLIWTEEEEE